MALRVECPHCGSRPFTEFWCAGEMHPVPVGQEAVEANFDRVWMRDNRAGVQVERWFHHAGCRRWLTCHRDTRTNCFVIDKGGLAGTET